MSLPRKLGLAAAALVVLGAGGWGALILALSPILPGAARLPLGAAFGVLVILALFGLFLRPLRPALVVLGLGMAAVAVGWHGLTPTNDADWIPEVSRAPTATIEGDRVTVHNVRNFAWRTESDFEERWEDRHYDLAKLERLDFIASFWAGENIAHTILSFGFRDGTQLAASIEIRRRKGQEYSPIAGFFRNYTLVYVLADERDVVRLRTNVRHERVYLYRLRTPPAAVRQLFLEYLNEANALAAKPQWYNTITANCTTQIRVNAIAAGGIVPWSWRILLSGHSPRYLYDQGMLDKSLPFAELRLRSRINEAAQAADTDPDFSQRIRAGLPDPLR